MRIQPWNLVFLIGFIVYVSIRGVFGQRTKSNENVVSRADALEKILMAVVIPGGLLLPIIYLFTPWLAGWYALAAFALMYFIRTPREEQMMCESFGQEYRDYMRETGRLFPLGAKKKTAKLCGGRDEE